MISLIVAMDKNHLIGKNGWMPWDNKEDLKHFRNYTMNKSLLVGRKTFEGFKKPLPHRFSYVLTHSDMNIDDENVKVIHDIQEVIDKFKNSCDELVVIGGAQIYAAALPFVDKMVLSIMDGDYEGDTFFPDFDENDFEVESVENKESFRIQILRRKETI